MVMPVFFLFSFIPGGLLLLARKYIEQQQPSEKASHHVFYLLLATFLALQLGLVSLDQQSASSLWLLAVVPVMVALIPITFFYIRKSPSLRNRHIALIVAVCVFVVALLNVLSALPGRDNTAPILIFGCGVAIILVWLVAQWRWLVAIVVGILVAAVCADTFIYNAVRATWSEGVRNFVGILGMLVFPIVLVTLSGRMVYCLTSIPRSVNRYKLIAGLIVAGLLAILLTTYVAEAAILDWATDGLATSMILVVLSITTCAVALLLAWILGHHRIRSAVVYTIAMTVSIIVIFTVDTRLDPQKVITQRAEQIDQAIQNYHHANNQYPPDLANLVPRYLLYIPNPILFRDQAWCYQGADDFYRLGYIYRAAFGMPPDQITIRIHSSTGKPPEESWACDAMLIDYRVRYGVVLSSRLDEIPSAR